MFSTGIIEKIKYYIYCLVDPRDDNIFYVGKGTGDRVFQHAKGAEKEKFEPSDKLELIKEIQQAGFEPKYYILRHNIQDEVQALEYEALAIDLLSIVKPSQKPLTNRQGGTHSDQRGLMSLSELYKQYDPQELKTDLPIILITINRGYDDLKKAMRNGEIAESEREQEIYQRTRKYWVVGKNRNNAIYAVAVYRGWTIAAYKISKWLASPTNLADLEKLEDLSHLTEQQKQERLTKIKGRWFFEGEILTADSDIYQVLVNKTTYSKDQDYKAPQNPITYKNCGNSYKN
ncbi:Uncharacterised protein [Phocoenobacter uteri]|uniref:GIY-YIG domain-containing protein n=1 Tax=Phocoenobacter uteri TaxID=146806 RepID=A0A379CA42_9PAST|nr:hypothetical protein [Phocoenobacter uteri]MDG6882369.1 hypothetical protein [Phocoenobacter uteri]SUB58527.1 Uncharacterised protein [Phocoenobacter uteri]